MVELKYHTLEQAECAALETFSHAKSIEDLQEREEYVFNYLKKYRNDILWYAIPIPFSLVTERIYLEFCHMFTMEDFSRMDQTEAMCLRFISDNSILANMLDLENQIHEITPDIKRAIKKAKLLAPLDF